MGLDITAYANIEKLNAIENSDYEPIHPETLKSYLEYFSVHINPSFPEQADGLEDGFYSYEDSVGFRAGSYGGYNNWRETLALLAGYTATKYQQIPGDPLSVIESYQEGACEAGGGPFFELLCFSDCEGVIGAATAKKLAADFAQYDEAAKTVADAWFYEKYKLWQSAFKLAAQNGAVIFH